MLRLSFFHWLPIADNMMPEIERTLQVMEAVSGIEVDQDSVTYQVLFSVDPDDMAAARFPIKCKLNQRGFVQSTFEVAPFTGVAIATTINTIVPTARQFLARFLFDIVPIAVRNKLAVLKEGIVSSSEFPVRPFDPRIESPAKSFLEDFQATAILLDQEHSASVEAGFQLPALNLEIAAHQQPPCTIYNEASSCILLYSRSFHEDEIAPLDGVVYKLCALATFLRFISRVIHILKETRDHIIPLRRGLVIALQRNTEDHFELFTQVKKYLTYVNIKLPVVRKVLNHLSSARESDQFAAKVDTFDASHKLIQYSNIGAIRNSRLNPLYLIGKIKEDADRLNALYDEDESEIQVISNELSQVLDGTLASESLEVSARRLDAALASLELDRVAGNRANALKILSVLLSANLGALAGDLVGLDASGKLVTAALVTVAAWMYTDISMRRRSSYYRLVIPVNHPVNRKALEVYLEKHDLKRTESNGARRIRTWDESLCAIMAERDEWTLNDVRTGRRVEARSAFRRALRNLGGSGKWRDFSVTMDYEKRGFLHSVTLETEYYRAKFSSRQLVEQVFERLLVSGCLEDRSHGQYSLFAEVLSRLDILIEPGLPVLNRILSLPSSSELASMLSATAIDKGVNSSLSDEEQSMVLEIKARTPEYKKWLLERQTPSRVERNLVALLGDENVRMKLTAIERSSAHEVSHDHEQVRR